MMDWLWALAGAVVGVVQARLLARAARGGSRPWSALLRLSMVGAVLLLAARSGQLAYAATAWALAFFVAAALAYRELRVPR